MNEDTKIKGFEAPIYFEYSYTAGATTTLFLKKLLEGKFVNIFKFLSFFSNFSINHSKKSGFSQL